MNSLQKRIRLEFKQITSQDIRSTTILLRDTSTDRNKTKSTETRRQWKSRLERLIQVDNLVVIILLNLVCSGSSNFIFECYSLHKRQRIMAMMKPIKAYFVPLYKQFQFSITRTASDIVSTWLVQWLCFLNSLDIVEKFHLIICFISVFGTLIYVVGT